MTQRQIDAAFRRSLKTSYKHLTPEQKRIVKAQERYDQLHRDIGEIYRLGQVRFGPDFRKHPGFLDDFDLIATLEEEKSKLRQRIKRLENKHRLDCAEVMKFHRTMNSARSSAMLGGSF